MTAHAEGSHQHEVPYAAIGSDSELRGWCIVGVGAICGSHMLIRTFGIASLGEVQEPRRRYESG
jgi:hypothetical protein